MSSSEQPRFSLTLEAPEPGVSVAVLDAGGSIVARNALQGESIKLELPRGLYIARASRGGLFNDTTVRLTEPRTLRAEAPPRFTAATIPDARTTHEYYTDPAWHYSQHPTTTDMTAGGSADAGLLLFVRAPDESRWRGDDPLAGLSLRTPDGEVLTRFANDAERDLKFGWGAYSARMVPGLLLLDDRSEPPRQIPVPLLPGWQTQVFVMHDGRRLWEDVRVSTVALHEVASRSHSNPYDSNAPGVPTAIDFDAGMLALQNSEYVIAERLTGQFLAAKFENPVLGLLGAYLLLLRARLTGSLDKSLARLVLRNLDRLLPDSADVRALHVLADSQIDLPVPTGPVQGVPLFRCGAEALMRAAAKDPELVVEGSLLDNVSERLYGDTAWTSWRPLDLPIAAGGDTQEDTEVENPDWLEVAVADAVAAAERRDEPPAVEDLMRQVGVSPPAFLRAFDRMLQRATSKPESLEGNFDLVKLGGTVAQQIAERFGNQHIASRLPKITGAVARIPMEGDLAPDVLTGVLETLASVAKVSVTGLSDDTKLSSLLGTGDFLEQREVRRRLLKRFDVKHLSVRDLQAAGTVGNLTRLIKSRTAGDEDNGAQHLTERF